MAVFRVGKKIVDTDNIYSEFDLANNFTEYLTLGSEGYFGDSLDEIMFCVKKNITGKLNGIDYAAGCTDIFIKDELKQGQIEGYALFLPKKNVTFLTEEGKENCEAPTWKSKVKELEANSTHKKPKMKTFDELFGGNGAQWKTVTIKSEPEEDKCEECDAKELCDELNKVMQNL
jgi:hypothetical protein